MGEVGLLVCLIVKYSEIWGFGSTFVSTIEKAPFLINNRLHFCVTGKQPLVVMNQ